MPPFIIVRTLTNSKKYSTYLTKMFAMFIQNAQQLFNNSIKNELLVILLNFQCITDTITCLEKSGVHLEKILELV